MNITDIVEKNAIIEYLTKRDLLKQYKKAKWYILSWYPNLVDFKLREPKEAWFYYFRINKQFRAIWKFRKDNIFAVLKIDNHQN